MSCDKFGGGLVFLLYSFLFCGLICGIAQIILDNTKLTPGHITSIYVCLGAFLDTFNIYDNIIKIVGGGALLPITSFGHSLIHASILESHNSGVLGLFMGMFNMTAVGITSAIVFSFIFSIIFKPKN